jgi:hypothetical protein
MWQRIGLNFDTVKWMMAVCVLLLFGVALLPPPARVSPSNSDDWRRTAEGWERMTPRQSTAAPIPPNNAKPFRFDSHPAVLALCQLILSLFGLSLCHYRSSESRTGWSDWLALLTRSFRASAFG